MRPSVQEDECGCPELQFVRSVVSEVHVVDEESSFSRAYFYFQICLLFVVCCLLFAGDVRISGRAGTL